MDINLRPTFEGYSHTTTDGLGVLAAYANFRRQDGSFSGLSMSLQASPIAGLAKPHTDDAELFFQAVALVSAAPKLLEALVDMVEVFGGEYGASLECINAARTAIAAATTHPLQDELEAEQREYELGREAARLVEHDDDRDHLTDDNTDFGDDLDEAARAYSVSADDIDPETLQGAADVANEAAAEDRLLGGAA